MYHDRKRQKYWTVRRVLSRPTVGLQSVTNAATGTVSLACSCHELEVMVHYRVIYERIGDHLEGLEKSYYTIKPEADDRNEAIGA